MHHELRRELGCSVAETRQGEPRAVREIWFNGGERLASVIERATDVLLTGGGWSTAVRSRQ